MSSYNNASSSSLRCLAASVNRLSFSNLERSINGHGGALRMRSRGCSTCHVWLVESLARRSTLWRFVGCASTVVEDLGSLFPFWFFVPSDLPNCSPFRSTASKTEKKVGKISDINFQTHSLHFFKDFFQRLGTPAKHLSWQLCNRNERFVKVCFIIRRDPKSKE